MGAPSPPPMPKLPPPPPTMLDPSITAARDRARSKRRARAGRKSTILTGPMGVTTNAPTSAPSLIPQVI